MLPNDVLEKLSTYQYHGYKISLSVMHGEVDEDTRLVEIGPIVHSRWLTLACRILRLHTATDTAPENLVTLAQLCLKVNLPTWFEIKHQSKLTLLQSFSKNSKFFQSQSCRDCIKSSSNQWIFCCRGKCFAWHAW